MKMKSKVNQKLIKDAAILSKVLETDLITAIKDLTAVLKSFDNKIFNIVNTNDSNKTQTITFT